MSDGVESAARRVQQLLEAHAEQAGASATDEVPGVVSVTVNSRLRVTQVRLLDTSIDDAHRAALELAIADAVNGAVVQVVRSSAHALSALRDSEDWKSAVNDVFEETPFRH